MTGSEFIELAERITDVAPYRPTEDGNELMGCVPRFFRSMQPTEPTTGGTPIHAVYDKEKLLEAEDLSSMRDENNNLLFLPGDYEHTTVVLTEEEVAEWRAQQAAAGL